jgi:flavin-dependent dehydrogenase
MRRTAPLILGAGPAGCAAAIALAQGGAAAVLLDREAEVRDPLCGGFLSWRTAARLAELGVEPRSLGAHCVTKLALFAGSRSAEFTLPAPAFGLSRRALDGALRARAIASGARLEIDTARAIDGQTVIGRERTWAGDGLFLATGKHDVRGQLRSRPSSDPALGLRVRLPHTPERRHLLAKRIELHLFAGGYAGIVLQEDGSANLCLAVRKSHFPGEPRDLLANWAKDSRAFAERLADDWAVAPFDGIGAVPYGYHARRTEPGLFRLGDQAAVIPSLAGEGIAIALASGGLAARHWLAGGAATAPAYQREFARRAAWPLRAASLAWWGAETGWLAPLGVGFSARVPRLLRWLMNATRLDCSGSLAQVPAHP